MSQDMNFESANLSVEPNVAVVKNAIASIAYYVVNDVVDQKTYRVTFAKSIRGYRKDADGNRIECDVISYLVPRNVFLAQVLNKLPMLARIYNKKLEQFKAIAENEGKILDFTKELNSFLRDGEIVFKAIFHAAGETFTNTDGTEGVHKFDKINVDFVNIKYGPAGAAAVAQIEATEIARMAADAAAILGL